MQSLALRLRESTLLWSRQLKVHQQPLSIHLVRGVWQRSGSMKG